MWDICHSIILKIKNKRCTCLLSNLLSFGMSNRILLLVGLPGSGKSVFSTGLVRYCPDWERVNQDDMKTRKKCEFNTKRFLDNKKNVIIDRCNFDEQQRAVWINIAKEYNVPIDCVVFTTTLKECAERIKVRENHPTGVTGDEGLKILQRFVSNYQPPTLTSKEGFDRIIFLDPSPTPTCTKERVDQVLQQLY